MNSQAIEIEKLEKSYGSVQALRGITLSVQKGEILGLLGPNGAGKTSTLEILTGIRRLTAGRVSVLGLDPAQDALKLRQRLGVCLQQTAFPAKVTIDEAVRLEASFFGISAADARKSLDRLGLGPKRGRYYGELSGGEKQRLALSLSILRDTELLIWDEPSAGVDPQVRNEIHVLLRSLRAEGRTVLLSTHYLEEAESLCDRVAILDRGLLAALGKPADIVGQSAGLTVIEIETDLPAAKLCAAEAVSAEQIGYLDGPARIVARSADAPKTVSRILDYVGSRGAGVQNIRVQRPSFEEAYLRLCQEMR